jgi:hypothetical protein
VHTFEVAPHVAGERHMGPLVSSHAAPSAAAPLHVPVLVPVTTSQCPDAEQATRAPLISPHGCPTPARGMLVHTGLLPVEQ